MEYWWSLIKHEFLFANTKHFDNEIHKIAIKRTLF